MASYVFQACRRAHVQSGEYVLSYGSRLLRNKTQSTHVDRPGMSIPAGLVAIIRRGGTMDYDLNVF
jgi:hypothetical protein